jgi:hypothetical protein
VLLYFVNSVEPYISSSLLLGHKTQQQIEKVSNHSNEPSFLALLSSSQQSFEYSITGEPLLIYVVHDESTYTYLCVKRNELCTYKNKNRHFLYQESPTKTNTKAGVCKKLKKLKKCNEDPSLPQIYVKFFDIFRNNKFFSFFW